MHRNIGYLDRGIRFGVAMLCAYLAAKHGARDAWFWALCLVGGAALVTGLVGWCGIYAALGISTREKPEGKGPAA
jgi:hypothetical protein